MAIAVPGRKMAAAFGLVAATTCGGANADPARLTANSGREIRLVFVSEVNLDCKAAGTAVVDVINTPFHGQVRIQNERGLPSFAEDSPRRACNQRQVKGVGVYYTSDKDYAGDDYITLHYGFPDGNESTSDFVVTVK